MMNDFFHVTRLDLPRSSFSTIALVLVISFWVAGDAFAQSAQTQTANEAATVKMTDSVKQSEKAPAQPANPPSSDSRLVPALDSFRLKLGFDSLYFTTVPLAAAVLVIIIALWIGKSDISERLVPFFGDGQLGQYVVIVLVAGNVCTLALVGLLNSSEVGTIYGGIIGYVLGKKSNNDSGKSSGKKAAD